ncbi:catalase easC [Aspergillus homomorphus CBS 101889]|uniref:Putative catalase Cat n=1 Tax=Aspergillus homomorphus (strain CBS 101889) TaxID=1450537 RepID=A0A395I7D2_ASPHC|nr:putative catalase Cat [Aspergillus homomorphus CBS 101889]RAL15193.1 putative catalase Cat [Aspergillus homomorphus CBS 101889]
MDPRGQGQGLKGCPVMAGGHGKPSQQTLPVGGHPVIEALASFNREKIPERPVHAKGAGAYGVFEVTEDISDICNIDMLLGVGKKTACMTRFSTTGLERGSSEGVRDLKGMAIKFFTEQGEWDWVCLNFPFFFIRDPIKFPDLMHAQTRDPQTNLLNPNHYWEWVTANHESLHMVLLQFSDFGTMFTWRTLSGYVGHAFKWVMPDGSFKYVHFFLSSDRGPNFSMGQSTADDAGLHDPDHASRDLYEAIERGEYPTWTANVQVIDPADAPKLGFNILDVTKHWNLGTYPKDLAKIPSRPFGRLTLNRNPQDYFREVEQRAFSPANLVPGVEPSEDPILQARMFAYADAQRYRLGQQQSPPQSRASSTTTAPIQSDPAFQEWLSEVSSPTWSQPHANDYKFAREYYLVLPEFRSQDFQDRMVENLAASVAQTRPAIRTRVYRTFELVHPELAQRIETLAEQKTQPATPMEAGTEAPQQKAHL